MKEDEQVKAINANLQKLYSSEAAAQQGADEMLADGHQVMLSLFERLVPPGRALSLAKTKLDEAMLWAQKGRSGSETK